MTVPDPLARLVTALARSGPASSDFDLNPDVVLPEDRRLRPAAVLVPIQLADTGPKVILTRRASALKHHPGQIAFPGGKIDPGDTDATAAALREAEEEIGLPRRNVKVLGTLPGHETVTGFRITPVLGHVEDCFTPIPRSGEVDKVFSVPLSHVTNPARFAIQSRMWRGQRRYYYTVPYGPYYIWGATARILRGLAERLVA